MVVMVVIFIFKKKIYTRAWLLESLDTPDLLKHSGYGGYCGYHGYRGYQEKLFWLSLVISVIWYTQPHVATWLWWLWWLWWLSWLS